MTSKRDKLEKKSFDFESSVARLETIIKQLEADDISLEDALKAFEDGIKLTAEAQGALKAAEQRVEILLEKNGMPEAEELAFGEEAQ